MIGGFFSRLRAENPRFDRVFHAAIADKAANMLGNFGQGSNAFKTEIARNFLHAARMTAEQIGAKGSLDDLIDAGAHASILEAGNTAARFSTELIKASEDPRIALASDAFAAVALLCYGNQGLYREHPDLQSTFKTAATLYGYAKAADELG